MKNYLSTSILTLLSIALLGSCASSKIALNENSPMAIISIVGNSYIPWVVEEGSSSGDEEGDSEGIINGLIQKVSGASNPEVLTAVDRIDYADESFRSIVQEVAGVSFIDKKDVVENEIYKSMTGSFYNTLSSTVKATNYKDFTIIGAKKARYIMDSVGASSLAILDFTFKKEKIDETRLQKFVGGVVIMKVKILDRRGREIISKVYTEKTTTNVKRYGSDYDKSAFVDLFYEAIDNAICKFALEFMGTGAETSTEEKQIEKVQAVKLALPDRTKKIAEESANAAAKKAESDITNTKVQSAVTLVKKYNVSPEDAAKDMGAPLDKVLEALKKDAENSSDSEN